MEKIGFIGLGRMGLPMAANLVRGNYPVWGFDTDDHQLKQAEKKGCTLCSSVSAVVEIADIVITMLPNSKSVEDVYLSSDSGIFRHADKDMLFVGLFETLRLRNLLEKEPESLEMGFCFFPNGNQ